MKHITKPLQLPSGLQSGLPMLVPKDWTTKQAVAVTELLQDLLDVIDSHYQVKLYAYSKSNRITEFDVDDSNNQDGEPF